MKKLMQIKKFPMHKSGRFGGPYSSVLRAIAPFARVKNRALGLFIENL